MLLSLALLSFSSFSQPLVLLPPPSLVLQASRVSPHPRYGGETPGLLCLPLPFLFARPKSVLMVFGAAGSFVVITIWIYYSAIIVLFGMELTRANRHPRLQRSHKPRPRAKGAPKLQRRGPATRRAACSPGRPADLLLPLSL